MGMIGSSIMFQIGTVGGKKSAASIMAVVAAMGAGLAMLNKFRKDGEEFARMWRQLTEAEKAFAVALDQAGGGLVDTNKAVEMTHKIFEAMGDKAVPELATAIGKLTVDVGTKLGESYDQIQARVEKLIDAISKGQTRALKEYGIDLDNTSDLLLAQDEAMQKVIDRADGLTASYRDLGYQIDALINNKDTFLNLWYEWASRNHAVGEALAVVNDTLAASNKAIVDTDGAVLDVIDTWTGGITAMHAWNFEMMGMTDAAEAQKKELYKLISAQIKYNNAIKQQKQHEQNLKDAKKMAQEAEAQAMDAEAAAEFAALEASYGFDDDTSYYTQKGDDEYWSKKNQEYLKGGKGKGGGGGKKQQIFEFEKQARLEIVELQQQIIIEEQKEIDILREANVEQRSRIQDARLEQEILRERQGILSELAQLDPRYLSTEEKHELWDLEKEQMEVRRVYEQERLEYLAEEVAWAQAFGDTWNAAYRNVTLGAIAANSAMSALTGTVEYSIRSAILYGKVSGKVIAAIVRDAAIGGAAQSTIIGMLELVKAAAAYAAPFGVGAVEGAAHTAAAAQAFAQAAAMAGVAAGFHAMAGGAGGGGGGGGGYSGGGGGGGGGYSGGSGGGYGGWQGTSSGQTVTVNNNVYLDGEQVWSSVYEHNEQAERDGRNHLARGRK